MGRINQLTQITTLSANSVIAMDAESGGNTNKVTIQTLADGLRSFGNYATQTDLNRKQDVLTFDDAPTEDSDNPVTSGGIYNAIGSAMSNVYTKAETDNAIAQSTRIEDRYVSVPYTTTAGGQYNTNLKTIIDNDIPNGKKCVGIVGFTTNSTDVVPVAIRYTDSAYSFQVRNVGTVARNVSATVHYLCVKINPYVD